MKKNILIIHYNTPYLTECLVRSINLFVEGAVIYIFDNSDEKPFTAKFDNVTVFDNTKGQIINFDKWLENYPNRKMSGGRRNYWGSAKHCISVEKSMEIINDNFILMDSDVLLKRDCSDLFQDDCIYVGELQNQPTSKINRILPFICFINTEMCKKYNIHYFDDNFMHGLRKTPLGDMYDTGAVICKDSVGLKHKHIKVSDYIEHYNNASWMDTTTKIHNRTIDEWLKIHKKLWSNEKNKNVVYTCITGEYDSLINPKHITEGFDYICFTDNKTLKSDIWDIRPLPKETEELTQVKKQRFVKINPHLLLSEYDISIWVDGNVALKGDLNKFVKNVITSDCSVYVPKHPQRNCIYAEANVVVKMGKDKSDITKPQMEKYKKEGFPEKYGLLQSNIILRKHNKLDCIKLMEDWFKELKNGSHRDQLSFNYVSWKNKDVKIIYLDKNICKSEFFYWNGTHSKHKYTATYNSESVDGIEWADSVPLANNTRKKKTIKQLKAEFHAMMNTHKKLETFNVAIY
jgi:hypothetical protein